MLGLPEKHRQNIAALAFAGLAAIGLGGCAAQGTSSAPSDWFDARQAVKPKQARVFVCHTFGCRRRTPVQFSGDDLQALRTIIAEGSQSPAAERQALGNAVQWYERRIAPDVGSHNDVGGYDASKSGVPGQMDCIDEATNTTSLLMVAESHGMLRHHRVGHPVAKGYFLDGRYPHATAVVVEKGSKVPYAIDSWIHDNAEPPDIMDLDTWMIVRN